MIVSDKYVLDLFNQLTGYRSGWRCEFPGCNAAGHDLNPHHVYSRDYKTIRYDSEYNGIYLCTPHHVGWDGISAHHTPTEFLRVILENKIRSEEWFLELIRRKNKIVKFNNSFRVDWKERLQRELRGLAA